MAYLCSLGWCSVRVSYKSLTLSNRAFFMPSGSLLSFTFVLLNILHLVLRKHAPPGILPSSQTRSIINPPIFALYHHPCPPALRPPSKFFWSPVFMGPPPFIGN